MQIIKIVDVKVIDSSGIQIRFSHELTPYLTSENFAIISDTVDVPSPSVLKIKIKKDVVAITCQPLTPFASYYVEIKSTPTSIFQSKNGDAVVSLDAISNRFYFTGPIEPDNVVKNYLLSYFRDNIYNTDDPNSLISKYIDSLSILFSRALYDIRQIKNENYLSFNVIDEEKTRGAGPFDRLNEESAYEIIRVGKNPTDAKISSTSTITAFPSYPVTLQKQSNIETLKPSSTDVVGYFNINNLVLTLSNSPVTRVISITFTLVSANPVYQYGIETLGYQIKNPRYDQDFAFTYLLLNDNQIKISDKILQDPLFKLDGIVKVDVVYESKDLGIVVDDNSVSLTTIDSSIREVLPPIINIFNLKHAPIVDVNGNIATANGITFTNTYDGSSHPAFLYEMPFRLESLPFATGQYSIDYSTGTVYVYGESSSNDGTGPTPPVATYNYRITYKSEQDYVYDNTLLDVVALPNGNLIDSFGTLSFLYEKVLIPDIDYKANLHKEELSERINNNLVALNVLKTQNSPITDVFRIYNETSGEIYTLDRWAGNKIYFRYTNPPRLLDQTHERVSCNTITNELLFVNATLLNSSLLNIFKIYLQNNSLTSSTDDGIGSSINTGVVFSDPNTFVNERWFDRGLSESTNIDKLLEPGQYMIDYTNGVVYCVTTSPDVFDIGTISYKTASIVPQFPHIISVNDLYYQINILNKKDKNFDYTSFDDGVVIPETLDFSDELYLNNNASAIYQIHNNEVGVFNNATFIPGVTNAVSSVRAVMEFDDLSHSTRPLNFANSSSANNFVITVSPMIGQCFDYVKDDGANLYVEINQNIPYISPNINYTFSVVRESDQVDLWAVPGTVVAGEPLKLILSGSGTPSVGDLVNIEYNFAIVDLSRIIVDYNKGDLYIDYTYLADEIIVSYEHGDNILDFRQSNVVPKNSTYYVSYKAGALRNALSKNFGRLVDIPELTNFDVDFDRERYRDALTAALTSFIQGPTKEAISNIGKTISHIEPEISESVFENWSLGNSFLNPKEISTSGDLTLLPARYDNGVLIDSPGQTISIPSSSNLRFEEGTFETWVIPSWNGIDNDASLTLMITKDGYEIDPLLIMIGASETHPDVLNGQVTLSKLSNDFGSPTKNKPGIFIYYDLDATETYFRWYLDIVDGYSSSTYKIKINSTGSIYDAVMLTNPVPSNIKMFTGTNSINLTITGDGISDIDYSFSFVSDVDHYLLDLAENKSKNRLSLYKDPSGYFNFKVFDNQKNPYIISSDVSSWKSGEQHHVAASWKLNTINNQDEMHLFIDGFEVPNILRYGQKVSPYLHEKFRTISKEEVLGSTTKDIVASTDLVTIAGSALVSSSINFSAYNISPGDIIYIDESAFSPSGYSIVNVNGQELLLSTTMPQTLSNARFSVNRTEFIVNTEIDMAKNIVVSTINSILSGTDLSGSFNDNIVVSGSLDFSALGVLPGYSITIDDPATNPTYTILEVTVNSLTLDADLTVNLTNVSFRIYDNNENELNGIRAANPYYGISKDQNFNNILTISNGVLAGDLILIRTLGLSFKKVKKTYYVWSDGAENVLMTRAPAPISLNETNINRVILPSTAIGPSNSTVVSYSFVSNNISTYQPSESTNGRTLSINIVGTNVDFTSLVQVTVDGISGGSPTSEIVNFDNYGTIDTVNAYTLINYISVTAQPFAISKNALNVFIKEKYPITHSESDGYSPVIRYSYEVASGTGLQMVGPDTVADTGILFSDAHVNNYLFITSPLSVAGYYKILSVSIDKTTLTIDSTPTSPALPLSSFTNGIYTILKTTDYRSGLQNGFFTFEIGVEPGQPYYLSSGFYQLEYYTYMSSKFDPNIYTLWFGSDFNGNLQINAILDQIKIYSVMLTDTRIGESIPQNQRSVTKDFNSLKPLKKDINTLMLMNFNETPFVNESDLYVESGSVKKHFYSSDVINENFGNSLVVLNDPVIIPNDGVLDTRKEGTIEFWVNPLFDTANDPNYRYYFDAYGAITVETVSLDEVSVKLGPNVSIGEVLSVKVVGGDQRIDYFAGGHLEIDTQDAITEDAFSINESSTIVQHDILQVLSVKIVGDFTETDYFANGMVASDKKTIWLGKPLPSPDLPLVVTYKSLTTNNKVTNTQIIRLNKQLPNQKTAVSIVYLPKGVIGNRMSIYKDLFGNLNFSIMSDGYDYSIQAPLYWSRDTWHRIKASYRINGGVTNDQMLLFVDGYEYGTILTNGMRAQQVVSLEFKDSINQLYVGAQYNETSPAYCLMDNLRISNIFRPIYAPYGESIDVNYNSNLDVVFPVTQDLFTTYLLNSDVSFEKNTDFALLKNRNTGLFDFSVNILDSLGIVKGSRKSKEALEKIIKILKPANSRVFISYE